MSVYMVALRCHNRFVCCIVHVIVCALPEFVMVVLLAKVLCIVVGCDFWNAVTGKFKFLCDRDPFL